MGAFGGGGVLQEAIYLPLGQADPRFVSVVARSSGASEPLFQQMRDAAIAIDPNLPLYWVMPMMQALDDATFLYRINGVLFTVFGASALFLAAVGLYGVIDFSVSSRIREMGLRMALEAEGRQIVGLVLRRVLAHLAVGTVVGIGIGVLLGRPLGSMLTGVRPWDPAVYGTIVGTMALTALIAALMPARRAVGVDPVTALRE